MKSNNSIMVAEWEVHLNADDGIIRKGNVWGNPGESYDSIIARTFEYARSEEGISHTHIRRAIPAYRIDIPARLGQDCIEVIKNEDGTVTVMIKAWALTELLRNIDNAGLVNVLNHANRIRESKPAAYYELSGTRPGEDYGKNCYGYEENPNESN